MRSFPTSIYCPSCHEGISKHAPRDGQRLVCQASDCGWYECPTCRLLTVILRKPGPLGTTKLIIHGQRPWPPPTAMRP